MCQDHFTACQPRQQSKTLSQKKKVLLEILIRKKKQRVREREGGKERKGKKREIGQLQWLMPVNRPVSRKRKKGKKVREKETKKEREREGGREEGKEKERNQPVTVAHTCNPSTLGG